MKKNNGLIYGFVLFASASFAGLPSVETLNSGVFL